VTGVPATTATSAAGTLESLLPQAVATITTRATRAAAAAIRVGFMWKGSLVGVAEVTVNVDEGALIRSCDLLGFVDPLRKTPLSSG
jgi:hypothetical protein